MQEHRKQNKIKYHIKIPKLHAWQRVLLYLIMVVSAVLAIYCAVAEAVYSAVSIAVYVVAAVSLMAGCYYMTLDVRRLIRHVKGQIYANPYTGRVAGDYRLKTVVFAVPGLISNVLFAGLHGVMGLWYQSAWFGSLAAYYLLLGVMRIGIVWQERRIVKIHQPEERMAKEIAIYRRNSMLFIVMAAVLGGLVILLVASEGGSSYPGFTIYAVAFYVFYKLIRSFMHMAKAAKHQSPLLMITRKITNIDAWTSLLILQTAMFSAFGTEDILFTTMMNGITGAVVCLMILGMGIQGVLSAREQKERLEKMLEKNDSKE